MSPLTDDPLRHPLEDRAPAPPETGPAPDSTGDDRPPHFLEHNAELWRAWRRLQASGDVLEVRGHGWRVWGELLNDGTHLLALAVEFRPVADETSAP